MCCVGGRSAIAILWWSFGPPVASTADRPIGALTTVFVWPELTTYLLNYFTPPVVLEEGRCEVVFPEVVLRSSLRYLNHTKAFWNQVDKVLPDYRDREEWLRLNGAGMNL